MAYLFILILICGIGFAVYELRASFIATQDVPPSGPDTADSGKSGRADKR